MQKKNKNNDSFPQERITMLAITTRIRKIIFKSYNNQKLMSSINDDLYIMSAIHLLRLSLSNFSGLSLLPQATHIRILLWNSSQSSTPGLILVQARFIIINIMQQCNCKEGLREGGTSLMGLLSQNTGASRNCEKISLI